MQESQRNVGVIIIVIILTIIIFASLFFNKIVVFLFAGNINQSNSANLETAKFIAYLIGVLLLVWQIILTNRRTKAVEETARSAVMNSNLAEKSLVQDRFKCAIEHLGSNQDAVNLGAIYTLHQLAKDNLDLRKTVFEILCSYVREITSQESYKERCLTSNKIQSILNLLIMDENERYVYESFLNTLDLRGSFLYKASLSKANLIQAKLIGVNLSKAELSSANLEEADLTGAVLEGANMPWTNLLGARLLGVNMDGSNLQSAIMKNLSIKDAIFSRTDLRGIDFQHADFNNVNLTNANLAGSDLRQGSFKDTSFEGVKLAGGGFVGGAIVDSPRWFEVLRNNGCSGIDRLESKFYIDLKKDFTRNIEAYTVERKFYDPLDPG
jgi:uncharacterized protein YjbI with pentapeptide repeats